MTAGMYGQFPPPRAAALPNRLGGGPPLVVGVRARRAVGTAADLNADHRAPYPSDIRSRWRVTRRRRAVPDRYGEHRR